MSVILFNSLDGAKRIANRLQAAFWKEQGADFALYVCRDVLAEATGYASWAELSASDMRQGVSGDGESVTDAITAIARKSTWKMMPMQFLDHRKLAPENSKLIKTISASRTKAFAKAGAKPDLLRRGDVFLLKASKSDESLTNTPGRATIVLCYPDGLVKAYQCDFSRP